MEPLLIVVYVLAGAIAGTLAGLVGVGGGILYVPVLVYSLNGRFGLEGTAQVAVSTSLAVIIFSLSASAYTHYKAGNIELKPLPGLITGGVIGSVSASLGLGAVDADQFKMLLALFELLVAFQLLRGAHSNRVSARPPGLAVFVGIGLSGGLFSSFFGVGGGLVVMPLMHFFAGYKINKAVGSASVYMILVAIVGLFSHTVQLEPTADFPGLWHHIYLPSFLALLPTALVFNRVGALWVNRVRPERIKQGVGLLLLSLAALNGYVGLQALG